MDRAQPVKQTDARQKASKQSINGKTAEHLSEQYGTLQRKIQKKYKEIQRALHRISVSSCEPQSAQNTHRNSKLKKRYLNIRITATYLRKRSLLHQRRREPISPSRPYRRRPLCLREYCRPFREASESMRYSRYTSAQSGSLS